MLNLKKLGIIGIVIFLAVFISYYRTSKNFKFSIKAAFIVAVMSLQPLKAGAIDGAEGFTPNPNSHPISKVQQKHGHFANPNKNNLGPGAPGNAGSPGNGGSPGNDGSVIFPQLESKQKTEKRIDQIDHYLSEMESVDDSDSENESLDDADVIQTQKYATEKRPKLVKDPNLNVDGIIKLGKMKELETKTAQKVDMNQDSNTKNRRSSPMVKSTYEDEKSQFHPAFSIEQLESKGKHTPDLLDKSTAENAISSLEYDQLPKSKQIATSLAVCEA